MGASPMELNTGETPVPLIETIYVYRCFYSDGDAFPQRQAG
jgi:hypothetical protein